MVRKKREEQEAILKQVEKQQANLVPASNLYHEFEKSFKGSTTSPREIDMNAIAAASPRFLEATQLDEEKLMEDVRAKEEEELKRKQEKAEAAGSRVQKGRRGRRARRKELD